MPSLVCAMLYMQACVRWAFCLLCCLSACWARMVLEGVLLPLARMLVSLGVSRMHIALECDGLVRALGLASLTDLLSAGPVRHAVYHTSRAISSLRAFRLRAPCGLELSLPRGAGGILHFAVAELGLCPVHRGSRRLISSAVAQVPFGSALFLSTLAGSDFCCC